MIDPLVLGTMVGSVFLLILLGFSLRQARRESGLLSPLLMVYLFYWGAWVWIAFGFLPEWLIRMGV